MNIDLCRQALKGFAGKRVLVIGDLMLDEHIWGTVERISPEAPVMVVRVDPLKEAWQDYRPGGAANVARSICALGGHVSVVGLVGDDESGRILRDSLASDGLDVTGVLTDPHRPTTCKTRIWASHRQQVLRIDRESKRDLTRSTLSTLIDHIQSAVESADALILSDYDKGIFCDGAAAAAIKSANTDGKISVCNAKPRNLPHFSGAGVVTLNQPEASAASGMDIVSEADAEEAGKAIMNSVRSRGLVITRGAHGMCVMDGDCVSHIPPIEIEVYDAVGAGDAVASALTLSLACGLDLLHSGAIANCAGGAVVRKVGVVTTSVEEVDRLLVEWSQTVTLG